MFSSRLFGVVAFVLLPCMALAEAPIFKSLEFKGIYLNDRSGEIHIENFLTDDQANDVAFDASANMYVTGYTKSNFTGTTNLGFTDCYVAKYTSTGTLTWRVQLGTNLFDSCQAVVVDSSNNVYVAGITQGTFTGQSAYGNLDAFVLKLNSSGVQQWVRQFGTTGTESVGAIDLDTSNRPVIVGSTTGTLSGQTSAGGQDAFAIRYDANGNVAATVQFGTNGSEEAMDVNIDSSNRWFIAGYTSGTFSGQTNQGGIDAFIIRYSNTAVLSWVRQIGSTADDYGTGAGTIPASGNPSLSGSTEGTFSGQTSAGGDDAFIAEYSTAGAQAWLRQTGTSGNESVQGACADSSGNYYFAGSTTGTWSGQTSAGGRDAFLVKYNGSGTFQFARQFGSSSADLATSLICNTTGVSYISGYTEGSLPSFTNGGGLDTYFARYSNAGVQQILRQFSGL